MRLGVFLPNWVGDVVMATPALRALRKLAGPDSTLVGVMRPYVAEVLAGTDWLDETILFSKLPADSDCGRRAAIRKLRAANLDCLVLLPNSFRAAWIAWWSGARERIGFAGQLRSALLTKRLRNPSGAARMVQPVPTIDSYLRLAEAAGCPPGSRRLELATTPADEWAADAVWSRLKLSHNDSVVVLNPGGAYGASKHWPSEYFAALARRIIARDDRRVLVNCGPNERALAREIVGLAADPRVVGLADEEKLPIGLTKACIRRAQLVVTTDSGPRFIGIAFAKPVVSLFGPTDPRMTATHYDRETCLSMGLDCQPCMARNCPLGHHLCMRELTVDRVHAAVSELLESERVDSPVAASQGAVAKVRVA